MIRKSILFSFAFVLIALCNSSCSNGLLDGDWPSMEWQKAATEKVKVNGATWYHIPKQGGTCQFKCKNYKGFWISHVRLATTPGDGNAEYLYPEMKEGSVTDYQNLSADGLKVSIEGNTLNVTFDENQGPAKYVEVCVTGGDIFDSFLFVQD